MADSLMKSWEPWALEPEIPHARRVGPLKLWVLRKADELHAAVRYVGEAAGGQPDDAPKDENAWRRWVCGSGPMMAVLEPRMPDRSVIARPAMPVAILPGEEVEFFISIPIRVALRIAPPNGAARRDILEEPTVKLSNSWFGLPVEGELCYALKTHARRRTEDLRSDMHLAVCPLLIRNSATEPMPFERLCVHVQHLNIYAGEHHLWTNRGIWDHRGKEVGAAVTFENSPPARDGAGALLSARRAPPRPNLVTRAFGSFKSLAHL